MTRPTTISPTTTCDRKVYLAENIDVGVLHQPKPRIISLEPISRRSKTRARVKKRAAALEAPPEMSEAGGGEPPHNNRVSQLSVMQDDNETPISPAPSDVSFDSGASSAGTGSVNESGPLSIRSSDSALADPSQSSPRDRTITAAIELQKAGFLRGDNIPLKISVNHTKHIKSLHGIIVTLYRQARVDMHPILPDSPSSKASQSATDDYYPKSKTGLGGLSLSSAGSSHLFRKDLSQSFTSLIINPQTLNAEVKAAVRVPEEAFPTISSVPGGMISFRYYVEVILDLQGKLAGRDRFLTTSSNSPAVGRPEDSSGGMLTGWGGNLIDTQQIRRDKSVVVCVFEVVIGTRDSGRTKGKRKEEETRPSGTQTPVQQPENTDQGLWDSQAWQPSYMADGNHYDDYSHEAEHSNTQYDYHYNQAPHTHSSIQTAAAHTFLPPTPTAEGEFSEKERLRRAEATLLPSSPPNIEDERSAGAATNAPSAPTLPDAAEPHAQPRTLDSWPSGDRPTHLGLGAPAGASANPATDTEDQHFPTPAYHHHDHNHNHDQYGGGGGGSRPGAPTDDKQELHRQRLEMERSAPGDHLPPDEEERPGNAPPQGSRHAFAASAPVFLDEDEAYGSNEGLEPYHLPRYER